MNFTAVNCTADVEDAFPNGVFTPYQLAKGAFLVDVVAVIYLFGVIGILCDNYFVPSLELLCQRLKLSQDVAGATFMAAGSSAPELFTSVIGVFVTKGDIGLGTIIGSAVFNLFCIIGLCGVLTSVAIQLNWWAISRDCICYLISVAALVGVMQDSYVQWYEGLILLVLYASYIVLMFNNRRIEGFFRRERSSERAPLLHEKDESHTATSGYTSEMDDGESDGEEVRFSPAETHTVQEEPLAPSSPFHIPRGKGCKGCLSAVLWFLFLPCKTLFYLTIPNCQKESWSRWFPVTFAMSLVWIGLSSYIMVWMANNVGITFGIPDVVLGYTILAVGNSVPDAMASILVARDGYGDMAISNSIGSNIFDILLCLGLPWFLQTTVATFRQPDDAAISIHNSGSLYTALMLFGTVFVLLMLLKLTHFRLGKTLGAILLILYVITIAIGIFIDTYLFRSKLPPC